jgi:hypothetical protein
MKTIGSVLIKEMVSFARLTAAANNLNSKFYELGKTYDYSL